MLKRLQHALARVRNTNRPADCTRVNELLPLYIADDLSAVQTQTVARHLQTCAGCRAATDEYAASRAWLQVGAQAAFEDEFYDEIRATVLRQIRQTQTPAPFFAPRFSRGSAYVAASLALLTLLGVLIWHVQNQATHDKDAVIAQGTPEPTPAPTHERVAPPTLGTARQSDQPPRNQQAINKLPAQRVPRHTARTVVPLVGPAQTNVAIRTPVPTLMPAPHDAATQTTSEVARIEMQTADPNIRIIWLTPSAADDAQPKPEKR
jgi:anti-sigma factor RsiW